MPAPRFQLRFPCIAALLLAAAALLTAGALVAAEPAAPTFTPEDLAFFEKEVKPILSANCLSCHGAEKKIQGGLKLTSRESVLAGGDSGPAVDLEQPAESLLLSAINYQSFEMPPKGKLPQAQIEVLSRWVKRGLPWPAGAPGELVHHGPPRVDEAARNFWAFRPLVRPNVPSVKNAAWVRNPIDAFILATLEAKGLEPAPPAPAGALLRRLHYSITGLPPGTIPLADGPSAKSLLADDQAYAALVDQLLASRHFGEHWGRHWLDLVRYAETNSFERDNPKPFVWRYRDYVISAFNNDKPYDQFIREQLAGDELAEVTPETIVATGYYRLGTWDDEPADPLLAYYDGLDDIVGATGQTFLGLTVACARCHDHKIDPFPQRDYYQLLAFFHGIKHYGVRSDASVAEASLVSIATAEEAREFAGVVAEYEASLRGKEQELAAIEEPLAAKLTGGERDDWQYPKNRLAILRRHVSELISEEDLARYTRLRKEFERLERDRPKAAAQALAVKEDPQPRPTYILLRGNPQSHGDEVAPGFPAVLTSAATPLPALPPRAGASSGRRRVLADWIASPQNPLTARVMVNRLWQYHFGRGLVRSASNFGYQGTPPTHPELLDWLASEFLASGWSLKHVHRLILNSSAYRMASAASPEANRLDPENDLLSHFDLRRLQAEEIRDSILAVCGNLNLQKRDGPSVYPPIAAEVLAGQSRPGSGWPTSPPDLAAARSVFVHVKRSLAFPLLAAFDAPDPDGPCPVRFTTTQPTQALSLLNGEFLNAQAGQLASLARQQSASAPAAQVAFILQRVLQRRASPTEIDRGVNYLAAEASQASADEALRRFCLLALNLNEFLYLE